MAWEKFVTLLCDGCEDVCGTDETRVVEARETAPDWTFQGGEDLCPACTRRREQEVA